MRKYMSYLFMIILLLGIVFILPIKVNADNEVASSFPTENVPQTLTEKTETANNTTQNNYSVNLATSNMLQSAHPYANNTDQIWTYTAPGFFGYLQITFSTETQTEYGYDFITITDGDGKIIGTYSGTELSGKTIKVADDTINIRLRTNRNTTDYGFSVSSVTAVPCELISLNCSNAHNILSLNENTQLSVTAYSKTDTIYTCNINVTDKATYISSKPSIAEVSPTGLITAKGYGNVTITASFQEKTVSIEVNVIPKLSGISVSNGTLSPVFEKDTLAYTVMLPFGASVPQITATASDPNALIHIADAANVSGRTEITVSAPDNSVSNTYTLNFNYSLESDHPYANGDDKTWTYQCSQSFGPVKLSFSYNTYVESGYDFIYITDKNGNNIQGSPFTGEKLAGKTVTVPGDIAFIRLKSDSGVNAYGFKVLTVDEADLILGDANGDETISAFDAVTILQAVAGVFNPNELQKSAMDTNKDGKVSAFDAVLALKYVAGSDTGNDIGSIIQYNPPYYSQPVFSTVIPQSSETVWGQKLQDGTLVKCPALNIFISNVKGLYPVPVNTENNNPETLYNSTSDCYDFSAYNGRICSYTIDASKIYHLSRSVNENNTNSLAESRMGSEDTEAQFGISVGFDDTGSGIKLQNVTGTIYRFVTSDGNDADILPNYGSYILIKDYSKIIIKSKDAATGNPVFTEFNINNLTNIQNIFSKMECILVNNPTSTRTEYLGVLYAEVDGVLETSNIIDEG